MKPHYVCLGTCGGASANPTNCKTYGCTLYQKPLVECHCLDWRHEEILEKKQELQSKPIV